MSEMTATRIPGWWWRAAIVLAAAGAWSAAGYFLWESRVPGDLHVPHLDEHQLFTSRQLHRAADYERFNLVNWVLQTLALLAVFSYYAVRGARFARESAAGRIGTGMLLAMLGFALLWLVQLPFEIAGLWWERRHGVSKAEYWELIFGGWATLGGTALFLCLAVLIVMGLAGPLPRLWWLPGAAAFVTLGLLFTFVSPYLVTGDRPLRNPELKAAAEKYARAEGVEGVPVRVEKVHTYTSQANAYATGLGPSRRVFLWDTLLDGRFGQGEIKVVLGHEFGHHARHHLWKGLAWYGLFALPGTFLIALVARRRGGIARPEAMPLALLAFVVLTLAASPLENVISRHYETEADWIALETTRDPVSARKLFQHFSDTSLGDPTPPGWAYVMLDTHPSLLERIEFADAWRRYRGATREAATPAGS